MARGEGPASPEQSVPLPKTSSPRRLWSRRAFWRTLFYGGALGTAGYSLAVETHWLDVSRVTVPLSRLPTAFDGLTIAQLSDFHLGPLVNPAYIRRAVDVALGLHPDLVALTGDFVSQLKYDEPEVIVRELGRLTAPHGVWAVFGNHDHYHGAPVVEEALACAGIRLLCNANGTVGRGQARLRIAGVDDVLRGRDDLPRALRGIDAADVTILLAHEPDFADQAARDPRVGLQLSGHSHGGQVCLPFVGPLLLPPLARKYPQGLRRVGDAWLYTNRGLGTIGLPIRLNCRPEVTLFTLTAADPDGGKRA